MDPGEGTHGRCCRYAALMAPFSSQEEMSHALDFELLRQGVVILYLSDAVLDSDLAWLAARGYRVDRVECGGIRTESEFHRVIAEALSFPPHYGENLDALDDCMSDLTFDGVTGRVIVLADVDELHAQQPDFTGVCIDILEERSRHAMLFGDRMLVVAKVRDAWFNAIPRSPRNSLAWNSKEWLSARRGV